MPRKREPRPDSYALTVDALERWEAFGAEWRVVEVTPTRAVIELRECTGELVERHESADPDVIAFVTRDGRA